MDPFRLAVAILPLGLYCLGLGLVNLARRPILVSGPRDLAVLAFSVSGLVIVGPMELFMPEAAANRFGGYIWVLLITFYALTASLVVLLSRYRLVVYNVNAEQLRPILARVAQSLDVEARWAGDSLAMPQQDVQLRVESFPSLRNVSLIANGDRQSFEGWKKLETQLRAAIGEVGAPLNARGVGFIAASLLLIGVSLSQMFWNTQALAQGLRDMLRL